MFGFKNQSFNLVLEWPVLETKRLKSMKPFSDKAKEDLKNILLAEIGEQNIKLLDDQDLYQIGLFFLTINAEACKRRLKIHS